mgnify:CR=1 FL=1
MSDFIFKIQPNIILGSYTTSRLGQYIKEWGSKFMVIIDPILKQVGTAEKITNSLTDRNIDFFTFDSVPEGSDTQVISDALKLAREAHVHGIVAVGGGKAINLARAVAVLYNESKEVYDFLDGISPTAAPLPLISVLTTMRDAFVFTDKVPVIDARSSKVKILKSQGCICKLVLVDPNLTSTLTENQTASMAIETLCFAIEAYLSQKSTFFSDMIAEKAIEVLGYKEFYNIVHTIKFEFINFDIISQRQNIENIKKFMNLKSLIFRSNNMHGFYQIIKLENIKGIEYITIRKNEICNGEILKYFLVYRLQNIKYFNDNEITNKDIYMSKKIFEHFDQAISICENESQKLKNNKEDKENGSALVNKKELNKNEVDSNELKFNFFSYAKINLTTALDEILDL